MATGQSFYFCRIEIREEVLLVVADLRSVSGRNHKEYWMLTGDIVPPANITALASSTMSLK